MEFRLANGWIDDVGKFHPLEAGSTHSMSLRKLKPEAKANLEKWALEEGWIRVAYL